MATQTGGIDLKAMKKAHDQALAAAQAIEQFFWHNSQDSGAGEGAGAHITEVPQEDFIADPANGGGNLLAQSGGIAIRDGIAELATFGASGAQIGQKESGMVRTEISASGMQIVRNSNGTDYPIAILGYGPTQSGGGTIDSEYFTLGRRSTSRAIGANSFACGAYVSAEKQYSFVSGQECHAEAYCSAAVGRYLTADQEHQFVVGMNNTQNNTDSVFVVGNGGTNPTDESDAFSVYKNGNVKAAGSITAGNHATAIGYKTARQTGTYSLASGTTWVTVPSANLSRITLGAGTWIIHAHASFDSNNTGRRALQIYSTTESEGLTRSFVNQTATNGAATNMQTCAIVAPTSNNTFTIQVAQNSGSARSVGLVLEAVRIA